MLEISPEEAQRYLAPYHAQLLKCVDEGWRKYLDTVPLRLPLISPRGLANAAHEFMIEEARSRLGGLAGVTIDESVNNRFLLYINGKILIRFKKLDRKLRTSNYPTQASLNFDAQQEIPELPRCARLSVGYQLDRMRRHILAVYVLYGRSRRPTWYYDLRQPAIHEVVEFPFDRVKTQATDGAAATGRRVRAKRRDAGEKSS